VHFASALQSVEQFPPTQLIVHVAPVPHDVVQCPLGQLSEHVLPALQSVVHDDSPLLGLQLRLQFCPALHVH
jgi:hypothetical protein